MTNETKDNKKLLRGSRAPRRGEPIKSFFKKRPPGDEEPPPVLGSWRNLYWLVLGNLLVWIAFFTLFTWMFQ